MNIIKAMGLGRLLHEDVWQRLDEHICSNTRYVVPGYQYNYRFCSFPGNVEFHRCEDLDGRHINTDIHFSGYNCWGLEVRGALDTSSTAHFYTLISRGGADIPVRLVSPDIFPAIERGDVIDGQVVAFAETVVRIAEAQADGRVTASGERTATLNGRVADVARTEFGFENEVTELWELDVDTENGKITVLIPCDRLEFSPAVDDRVRVSGVISMDVAIGERHKNERDRPFYEDPYKDVIADADEVNYRNGFVPKYFNVQRVIMRCIESGDYTRLARCCRGTIDYIGIDWSDEYTQRFRDGLAEVFRLNLPKRIDKLEVMHLLSCDKKWLLGHDVIVVYSKRRPHTLIHFGVDEKGLISSLEFLPAKGHKLGIDHELHLHAVLAEAMCGGKPDALEEHLAPNCMYRSDYADVCLVGACKIIRHLKDVVEALEGERSYTYRHALAKDELCDQEDLALIYQGKHCTVTYYEGEVAYVVFLMYNEEHKITNILLSRSPGYLNAFNGEDVKYRPRAKIRSVTDILAEVYGSTDTVWSMRGNDIPAVDENRVYVWKKADEFALAWFRDNGYKVSDTVVLEECLGYACERRGVGYAFFFYAYGEERTVTLTADHCKPLRDTELAKGRSVIVIYLSVAKKTAESGETEYTVGRYGDPTHAAEPWLLTEVMGKSIFRFYPRKEMMDLIPRLVAAFNTKDLDALQAMCAEDVYLKTYEQKGRSLNSGFYNYLSYIRDEQGMARLAYLRLNDNVYSVVPYLEDYGYIAFSVNAENKINGITVHPFDNSYRELLVSDEVITHSPANEAPRIVSVDFLPPSDVCRYSLRAVFENGEVRRYDLAGDFGDGEVTRYQYGVMTDKIFANGRLTDHIPKPKYGGARYAERGQGIEFISGAAISALEVYENGHPIETFNYTGMDVFLRQSDYDEGGFAVGSIPHLDPKDQSYLLNRITMTATALPEKYQQTPIGVYPFYGGCSEGLVMVSEMGALDLQYHHNRHACAGLWGWLDTSFHVVIEPKYVYAMNFRNGRAIVCRGEWSKSTTEAGEEQYWCENERWGVIDRDEKEVVPCRFDEIYEIDDTDRLYFVHEGGWENGHYAIYDIEKSATILVLDFEYDMGYMFNECFVTEDSVLLFDKHIPGEEKDLIYAYDLITKRWISHGEEMHGRTFNGETRSSVYRDGEEIVIF